MNGRGTFFSATDPVSVINGLGQALADVDGVVASGAADGVSTLEPVNGNNFVFSTSFKSGAWWGDVQGSLIDPATGAILTPAKWSAKQLLDNKVQADCDDRKILLMRGSSPMIDFYWNSKDCATGTTHAGALTGAEQDQIMGVSGTNIHALSQYPQPYMSADQEAAIDGAHEKLLNFVRGQRQYEGYVANDVNKLFRTRLDVLGDIVGSQPVYVKTPFASYADTGYADFKLSQATRTPMVYVGANDGMLHAFNAIVDPLDAQSGQEKWAVIPSAMLPTLYKLADASYKRQGHQFYVDGTPVVGDIAVSGNWKTILVGGFNAGGKGYYALDVTDPANPLPLWEFKQNNSLCSGTPGSAGDCNLGYSFGKPIITKLVVSGTDTWVVMFTSGYNNVNGVANDGKGFLYVVNANTGALINKLATGAGDDSTPSGLAQINNYVDNVAINNETLHAYGGDLLGNIWRFDFGSTPSVQLIGTAKDVGGVPQPITVRPELAELDGKPMVFVGTGQFLGESDVGTSERQSVYGIVDSLDTASPALYTDLRASLRHMPFIQTGTGPTATRKSAACDAHCASTAGWVIDFPYVPPSGPFPTEKGERVAADMKLVLGTLVVGSIVPDSVQCSVGGHSWFNYLDFRTGGAVSNAPRTDPGDPSTATTGQYLADSLIVGFNVLTLAPLPNQSNRRFVTEFHMSDTTHSTQPTPVADPLVQGKRISWREITK